MELSERLARAAGGALGHCFYASDGASAVEIALKMSFHYWRNRGRPAKRRFVSLAGSYHGETLGALAVTDVALFKDTYAPLLMTSSQVAEPGLARRGAGRVRARLRRALRAGPGAASRSAPRRDRGADRRAAGAGRDRHGDVRRRIPAPRARAVRPLRGAPHRRRDHDRLRAHRHVLRARAGRHHARLPVRCPRA